MAAPLELRRVPRAIDDDPLDSLEVYPVTLEWGGLAEQLRELGVSRRDIAIALALSVDADDELGMVSSRDVFGLAPRYRP